MSPAFDDSLDFRAGRRIKPDDGPAVDNPAHESRRRFAGLLVDKGLLSPDQAAKALREHEGSSTKIGQFLIQKGLVNEIDVVDLLAEQLRIEVYNKETFPPDAELAALVPESLAFKQHVVPLKKVGSLLYIGMLDPTDMGAIDLVVKTSHLDVEPVVCTEQQYVTHFYQIYGKMLEGIEGVDIEDDQGAIADSTFTITSLQYMAEDAPIVKLVNSVLLQALDRRASDIHIQPEPDAVMLRFRVDGKLEEAPAPQRNLFLPFISRIKLLSNMDISVSRIPQDGRFTYRTRDREISVRTSTTPTIFGEKVVLRLLDQSKGALSMYELGMNAKEQEKIENAIKKPWGMILATGPTGSGKTTLLYSVLKEVNTPDQNLVTLEDPVEYRVKGIAQIQLNRKAGMTFATGLRSILRQDPDIIMVGEIRDLETADIAIRAALTGHKVLSTVHTNDAADTITRFIELGIEPFFIASTLLVCVAQRLVRRLCTDCKQSLPADPDQLALMRVKPTKEFFFSKPVGCPRCGRTGYRGRVGVYEVLEIDKGIQELVLRKKPGPVIRQAAVESGGLITLRQNAALKVLEGTTSFEEYLTVAYEG